MMTAVEKITIEALQAIAHGQVLDPYGYAAQVMKGLKVRTTQEDACLVCETKEAVIVLNDDDTERRSVCLRCGSEVRNVKT